MKTVFIALLLIGAGSGDFPLTARIVSAGRTKVAGTIEYKNETADTETVAFKTEVRIGNLLYTAASICRAAEIGQDYPAQIKPGRFRTEGRKTIKLAVGDKTCTYIVNETREVR